jgi:hypothetical protein
MSVKLKTPSNGSVTLAPEDTASDVTLTVPAVAGEILNDQSDIAAAKLTGDVAAARITDALNAGGSAPIYACRAWVNFNGTGTVAIRESGNVSSITDNGTGNYTVNFTTAMPDVNYAVVVTSDLASDGSVIVANTNDFLTARTTSLVRMGCAQPGVGSKDTTHYQVAIFR